jgi:hypothetical protein
MLSQTTILLTILPLVYARPIPSVSAAEQEKRNTALRMNYTETGKSWVVNAIANGIITEGVVIHLIQSQAESHRGFGAVFMDDGRFPKPDGYAGNVDIPAIGVSIKGKSKLLLKSNLDKAAFCPNSAKECMGSGWTARQTEVDPKSELPVTNSPELLETHVMFEDNVECESFISEWTDACDSFTQLIPVAVYEHGPDWKNLNRDVEVIDFPYSTNDELDAALRGAIKTINELSYTAEIDIVDLIVPNLDYLYDLVGIWQEILDSLWKRYETRINIAGKNPRNSTMTQRMMNSTLNSILLVRMSLPLMTTRR